MVDAGKAQTNFRFPFRGFSKIALSCEEGEGEVTLESAPPFEDVAEAAAAATAAAAAAADDDEDAAVAAVLPPTSGENDAAET